MQCQHRAQRRPEGEDDVVAWRLPGAEGATLVRQGAPGNEAFLLFDGVLRVEAGDEVITELGPGAIIGEMALLRDGRRTATLRAATPCRIAVVPANRLDPATLAELAASRQTPNSAERS